MTMQVHRLADAGEVTRACADLIIDRLGRALVARGSAVLALSGGSTPKPLYSMLATYDLQWSQVHVAQVDERLAPADHPDRNWIEIQARLVGPTGAQGHPMPTTDDSLDAEGHDQQDGRLRRHGERAGSPRCGAPRARGRRAHRVTGPR